MNYKNTWNAIVRHFKSNINEKEPTIQTLWEGVLSELFGYSKLMGLLVSQSHLEVGSSGSLIPDILLSKDGQQVCAVELKQETITLSKKIEKQLFSYLKQAKLSVGIIIADQIYLYAYQYEKDDDNQLSIAIPFEEDNLDGIRFAEVINRENFSKESVFSFVENKNIYLQNIVRIKESLNEELVKEAVRNHFVNIYTEQEVDEALSSISFNFENHSLPSKQRKSHKREPKEKEVTPAIQTTNSSDLDYQAVINGGLQTRKYLKSYFISKGLLEKSWEFNTGTLNKNKKFYWVNPKLECIHKDWCLALINPDKRKIYLFKIHANTISREKVVTRMHHHKDEAIQITIVQSDDKFVCSTCKIDYTPWLSATISF